MDNDLSKDLNVLQDHLDNMLDRVLQNSEMLKRFQIFEMNLLKLDSLSVIIDYLINETKVSFGLDLASLCLVDEDEQIISILNDADYDFKQRNELILLKDKNLLINTFGISIQSYLGGYKQSICADFFDQSEAIPTSVALIPLNFRGKLYGSINMGSVSENRFVSNMATDFIEHMITIISLCLDNILNLEILRRTSLIDPLTGVNNRLFLEQRIEEELGRGQRNSEPVSCLFLDVDKFKVVNDTHGHQAGDYVLTRIAKMIKKQLRSNDVLARYGGEEFVALLSNLNENDAVDIAERIRKCIKNMSLVFGYKSISTTISIGLATYQPTLSPAISTSEIAAQLIHSADLALYHAKQNGRDRVAKGQAVFDIVTSNAQLAS